MLVKVFNFSDKKPSFLEIIEVYLNLGIGFCINWLALPNYKNISSWKQFQVNYASHLNKCKWYVRSKYIFYNFSSFQAKFTVYDIITNKFNTILTQFVKFPNFLHWCFQFYFTWHIYRFYFTFHILQYTNCYDDFFI